MAPEKRKCLTEGTKTTPAMSQAKKALNEGHGLVLTQLDVTQETCRTSRREFAGSDSELFPAYHMSPSPWNPMASRALATHAWSNCFAICRTCRAVAFSLHFSCSIAFHDLMNMVARNGWIVIEFTCTRNNASFGGSIILLYRVDYMARGSRCIHVV